jgi:hypothetical protein
MAPANACVHLNSNRDLEWLIAYGLMAYCMTYGFHKDERVVKIAQCLFNGNAGPSRRGHQYEKLDQSSAGPPCDGKRPYQRASYSAYC